jgi:hypothetical protein
VVVLSPLHVLPSFFMGEGRAFQIDLNSIIQLLLILMIGYIIVKIGIFLDKVSMKHRNPGLKPKPVSKNSIHVPENNTPIINIK